MQTLLARRISFLKQLTLCLLFGMSGFYHFAQSATLGSLRFDHIGQEQGLQIQSITAIAQDQQGFMWFGTQAGLIKFDGYRTTVFRSDPLDPTTLSDNFASALYLHHNGDLWIGTQSGLSLYDRRTQSFINFHRDGQDRSLKGNYKVYAIVNDGAEGLWLATDYGLMHFDIRTREFVDYRHDKDNDNSVRDDLITDLIRDTRGNLWIATPIGLDRFEPQRKVFEHINLNLRHRNNLSQNNIIALSLDRQQTLWVGSEAGLTKVWIDPEGVKTSSFGDQEGFDLSHIQAIYHDQHDILWVGTVTQGLLRYLPTKREFEQFRHRPLDPNSLLHNHVSKIYQDQTGVLWIGAKSSGLSRVDLVSGGFSRYVQLQDDATGTSDNRIRAIAAAGEQQLWLGTYAGGLLRMNLNTRKVEVWQKNPKQKMGLPDNQIASFLPESDGRMWVGTRAGLTLFDIVQNQFKPIYISDDPNDNFIERIIRDQQGNLWVSSRGGLHRRIPGQQHFTSFRHDAKDPHSMANSWAMALLEDRQGRLWIGTMNGLDYFDREEEKFVHIQHDEKDKTSLSHNRVHSLFEDSRGRLWVGTSGGLNRMEKNASDKYQFQFYPTRADGSAESIGGILEDKSGNIWVSSTAGISRLDMQTGRFKNYTEKDGMIQGSFLIGAVHLSQDGTMNFGGWTGLTRFKPEDIFDNPIPPRVVITDLLLSDQSITKLEKDGSARLVGSLHDAKEIQLSYLDSIFSIEFSALHFANPAENRYAYQLIGFDPKWVETDAKKRFATYTNLDPGRYIFRVKASNKNGVWNEDGVALTITITPPFWKTWWFRILLVILLIGLTYAFFLFRVRQLMQQKILLEQQVAHRTQELQDQNVAVEKQKETLEHAHRNISLLSEIGKEITATLDMESIINLLYHKVNELMDASIFGIGFYDHEASLIRFPFVIEAGKRYAPYTRATNDKNQLAVWCLDQQKEVVINDLYAEYHHYIDNLALTEKPEAWGAIREDGASEQVPLSSLYVPFFVRGEIRGIINVQSYHRNAYETTDLDILRTLASYVGIALDNAQAYQQLQETQAQLVERDKLAALGSLVAGVAHELNTPLGNSLLIASSIEDNIHAINEKIASGSIKRSDLKQFSERSTEACTLLIRSLHTSANLVSSFKQVAVDQASAQNRQFNLKKTTTEIIATMMNQVRLAEHQLHINIPEQIDMHSYPGPYGQVLINLLQNALLHGFDGRKQGLIQISASMLTPERVQIRFEDNGVGIKEDNLHRIFEPFFTTKLGHGGSGLGLNVTYNIITSLLGGSIRVESEVGVGTSFFLELPITIEEQDSAKEILSNTNASYPPQSNPDS
ncbi:sensor histidine kinase [Undibacterium fentianense]|uniref:histidine kinase n=1 Tax=Undibacterium fentianense TaxID=2828728 RepID=A0A941E3I7_9BURK|nr:two-component regulator propeller domain-containing protein [Undibacterium fentianense]MBR7800542.1 GAF domain-containing protein [Undibacterium fentianense]